MSNDFEIIIMESNIVYGYQTVTSDKAVEKFIEICTENIPENVETKFHFTKMTLSLAEYSDYRKPVTIILVGNITHEINSKIRNILRK